MKLTEMQLVTDVFMAHYLLAMQFTEAETFDLSELPPMSMEMTVLVLRECGDFVAKMSKDIWEDESKLIMAGHDFWLTRNGHGAGFWDGDWEEPYASHMDKISKLAGEAEVYIGDDGLLYQSQEI